MSNPDRFHRVPHAAFHRTEGTGEGGGSPGGGEQPGWGAATPPAAGAGGAPGPTGGALLRPTDPALTASTGAGGQATAHPPGEPCNTRPSLMGGDTQGPAHLALDGVALGYGRQTIVEDFSLRLAPGEIGCLLGPSGCGKTTVLRAIAGFVAPRAGRMVLGGRLLADAAQQQPPETRRIGLVFQDFALFPHLSVAANVAFGIEAGAARLPRAQRRARIDEMLALVNLDGLRDRFPHQLSGGQQQRVALARALAPRPELLLMDEPFSSLDQDLRERLSGEVRQILKATGTTAILVTHDQWEAFAMSDRIAVMVQGRIEQWATPYDLYHRPCSRWVAGFIGDGVFLPGFSIEALDGGHAHVETELGFITPGDRCSHAHRARRAVDVLLRPDDVQHDDDAPQRAQVVRKVFRGAEFLYTLQLPSGRQVLASVPSHHDHAVGEWIGIRLATDHVVTFDQR